MSLSTAVVKTGATLAPTGGSDLTFAGQSYPGSDSFNLYVPADTDKRTARSIAVKVNRPKPSAGSVNGYSNARSSMTYYKPKVLTNGKIATATVKVALSYDIEFTDAEIQELIDVGAQMLFDADFVPTHKALVLT
jgi:hypothetical protein